MEITYKIIREKYVELLDKYRESRNPSSVIYKKARHATHRWAEETTGQKYNYGDIALAIWNEEPECRNLKTELNL